MGWDAIGAIATGVTAVIIAAAVIVGIRQLRLTRDTLEHLRRATQLEGAMRIFDDLNSDEMIESMLFINNDLVDRMADPAFRREVELVGLANRDKHKELRLMRAFERIGAYVRNGLLDGALLYDVSGPVIESTWNEIKEVVEIHRASRGKAMWENFEFLYDDFQRWVARREGEFLRPYEPHWSTKLRERAAARD